MRVKSGILIIKNERYEEAKENEMIIKDYHQTTKIFINQFDHWSTADPQDIERELIGEIADRYVKMYRIEPKIFLIGFRKTRLTMRGRSGIGRFHQNWDLFKSFHDEIDVKVGVKVT